MSAIGKKSITWHFALFFLLLWSDAGQCEWFSSLGQMKDLVSVEQNLMVSLKNYIDHEKGKLQILSKIYKSLQDIERAEKNQDKFLGHPVNQYRLIKRLSTDWIEIADIANNFSTEFFDTFSSIQPSLPGKEDLKGTAEALMRLQDTYQISAHDMLAGDIKGFTPIENLTLNDSFHIGQTAYSNKNYYHCVFWMKLLSESDDYSRSSYNKFSVLDYFAFCLAKVGLLHHALNVTKEILKFQPNHSRLLNNVDFYKSLVGETSDARSLAGVKSLQREEERPFIFEYEELCRSSGKQQIRNLSKSLKCYYWTNHNHPRLLLQPIKAEVLWESPQLVRFYDVISDQEIEELKELAKPRLRRATVHNPDTGRLEHAHYRVSKSAWFGDEHPVVAAVNERITDITGLSMQTAESLQVANYGVGGQYEPHFDIIRNEENVKSDDGNRIATFMFYLSDVDYGGSTVFLHPGISVKPIKGSAVFWFNLFSSGAGDFRTRHAACPVLVGVKWVANKWIHERGQEFFRPCGMDSSVEGRLSFVR